MRATAALLLVTATTATSHAAAAERASEASAPSEPSETTRTRPEARIDAVAFINRGYDLWLGVKPAGLARWTFGAGVFEFRQQPALVKAIRPSNDGIDVHKLSGVAYARYAFGWDPIPHAPSDTAVRGLFASAYAGYLQKTVAYAGAEKTLGELFLCVDLGYRYLPFGKTLFVDASVGFESTPKLVGDGALGPRSYVESVGEPIVFVAVGAQL